MTIKLEKILAVDIETMPNEEMIPFLPEVKPKANLTDPKKIQADIEEKKSEQLDKMALSPLYGQIACVGYFGESHKEVDLLESEGSMVRTMLDRCEDETVFTWNGKGFDFEFVIKRGVILDVCSIRDAKKFVDKYKAVNHVDLMEEWAGYNKYASLDEIAKVLLGSQKDEFDVKEIKNLIKTPSGQELIKRYCLKDCELVYKLARKMGF